MQGKRENIIRKIDFISICTESSTKFPVGFGSIIGDLWEIYGLSVAIRFLFFSFRFCRRDTEPLPKERLKTSIDTSKKNDNLKASHPTNLVTRRVRGF